MNPPSFNGSSITEDPENFVEEVRKWKKGRAEGAPILSWAMFEEDFLGCFFLYELRETKVEEEMLRDRDEFRNKKAKIGNESREQRKICNTSKLDLHNLKVVWHNEVIVLLHVLSVVGNTQGNRAQFSSVDPPNGAAPRGAASGTGGEDNDLYAITSR
ncbi:uncharacterized protein LOC125856045 [Solanum stenotomum]|uniref:uncharacterized protein LOC125856045 n=1 Tax=Solanum stenotomum TaxID=172797 RepID=UPI0020D0640B|nr:uncharacterized protein LOC125856045 [Solanum stenotomum]